MDHYHSFLVTRPQYERYISDLGSPDEWALSCAIDPSKRFWVDDNGRTSFRSSRPLKNYDLIALQDRPGVEIIISTRTEETAENVRDLIETGLLLGYPSVHNAPHSTPPWRVDEKSLWLMVQDVASHRFTFHEGAVYACHIADRAWGDLVAVYAIQKYKLSLSLDSFTPHSANPRHGQVFENARDDYLYHVNAGYAILAAYGVVEELGLEIRSSQERKRFINGEWNVDVYNDCVDRLEGAGANADEPFSWVLRGEPTDLHREIDHHLKTTQGFQQGGEVRDVEMSLVEALHAVSVIRNFIFAHKFDEVAGSVSPYDVFNAQSLARRLILSYLGLWKPKDQRVLGYPSPWED